MIKELEKNDKGGNAVAEMKSEMQKKIKKQYWKCADSRNLTEFQRNTQGETPSVLHVVQCTIKLYLLET